MKTSLPSLHSWLSIFLSLILTGGPSIVISLAHHSSRLLFQCLLSSKLITIKGFFFFFS